VFKIKICCVEKAFEYVKFKKLVLDKSKIQMYKFFIPPMSRVTYLSLINIYCEKCIGGKIKVNLYLFLYPLEVYKKIVLNMIYLLKNYVLL